jgi:hypothetical protein
LVENGARQRSDGTGTEHGWPFRAAVVLLVLALVASLLVGLAPTHAAAAPSCDRNALVAGRLAELGRFGVEWRVGRTPVDAFVITMHIGVTVSEVVTCNRALIMSEVNHEWMHTQQFRVTRITGCASTAGTSRRSRTCGSLLFGSRCTQYLDARALETCRAVVGCPAFEYGAAPRLLAAAGR